MTTDIERLKASLDLANLINDQHPLSNTNGRYRHGLKHDSLVVDTRKQEYWWNSRDEWGDVIDWIGRHHLGYDTTWSSRDPAMFKEAVFTLARLAGQPEPQFKAEDPKARERRLNRQHLLDQASYYYHINFLASEEANQYTTSRGWTADTVKQARLGYSDGNLVRLIKKQDRELSKEIGLIAERDGRWFDAIPAGCLVYPHRVRGRITYLSGRSIEGKRHHNLYSPKEMFWAVTGYGSSLVVVEGQADALSLAQWDISALALCGVNLAALDTDATKLFDRVYIAIDQDEAGQKNLDKLARNISPLIRLVNWPQDLADHPLKDVNDLLQAGIQADQFHDWLAVSQTYLDHIITRARQCEGADRDEILQQLFELLATLDSFPLTRYRAKVCNRLDLNRVDFDRLLSIARNETDAGNGFLRGEQYTIQDGWTIYKQHTTNGRINPVPLANASLRITELLERDTGSGEIFREYRLVGQHSSGRHLPACSVPTDEFSSMNWVSKNYPDVIVAAGRGSQDLLREAIQHLSGEITRRVIYEHTGWRQIDGHWCYLTGSGALGLPETESKIEVDLRLGRPNTYMELYELPRLPADTNDAILASLSSWSLSDYIITVPQWAACYLAPLAPFLPVDFGLWVHGRTGAFKSVLAALFLAHFGKWSGREARSRLPANFISTANNILMNAFIIKDSILVIDDYAPGNTVREMRERDEVASRLLRSVGNQAARGRMKDGRRFQSDYPPRCLALITAEDLPPGQSILARGIGVRVYTPPKGTSERTAIEQRLHQAQHQDSLLYPHAMSAYLLWVKRHWDYLSEKLSAVTLENQRRFSSSGHARLADAFGKLMTGVDTALFFMQDAGAITDSQAGDRRAIAFDALQCVMAEHAGQIESLDPTIIFIETLREELDAQTWYLAPYAAGMEDEGSVKRPYAAIRAGWCDNSYIYLLPKIVYDLMEAYSRLGKPFPVGRNTLYHRLQEKGWLTKVGTEFIPSMSTSMHILKIFRSIIYPEQGEGKI